MRTMKQFQIVLLAAAVFTTSMAFAGAVRNDPAFQANVFPANDDDSTDLVPMGFSVSFFGNTYDSLYINNNGNVTFDAPQSTFTPFPLTTTARVIIAPFFADVDTRGAGSGLVTYGTSTVDLHPALGVNWVSVGYFFARTDKLNSFQLVLIDRSDISPGDFDIEFNYDQVQWETGEASDGIDGLGGFPARVGYSNGTDATDTSFELPGSGISGAFLDSISDGLIFRTRDTDVPGRLVFSVRAGVVVGARDQTITFNPIPSHTFGEPPFALNATASSQLPVFFTASGLCAMSSNVVTLLGAGTCSITATQAGDANFNPAPSVTQSFAIAKAIPIFTAPPNSQVRFGTLSITLSGSLAAAGAIPSGDIVHVTLGGVVYSGIVQPTGSFTVTVATANLDVGSYAVSYSYAGNANFEAAVTTSTLQVFGTPFAKLKAEATVNQTAAQPEAELETTFTLGSNSDGIHPLADRLLIAFGPVRLAVPGDAFTQSRGTYAYRGLLQGLKTEIKIVLLSANTFKLEAEIEGQSVRDLVFVNPVPFSIQIGDDFGSGTVTARIF